jgi:hypothetical protein
MKRLFYTFATILTLSINAPVIAMEHSFLSVTENSYTLSGIVDNEKSAPFACMVGDFTVHIIKLENDKKYFNFEGSGILINSGWIHKWVNANPEIVFAVPENSELEDGDKVSLFVNSNVENEDGSAPLDHYVKVYDSASLSPASGLS